MSSNPRVYFDVKIGGIAIGRVVMVLRADGKPPCRAQLELGWFANDVLVSSGAKDR